MKATTNTSIDTRITTNGNDNPANSAEQEPDRKTTVTAEQAHGKGKPESELRAAARRKGLTLKQLAGLMGVSYGYVSQVSSGSRPWTPMLRERAMAVLGEVPGQGVVYRQGGVVNRRDHLHPGAGPGGGIEHQEPWRNTGGGVFAAT